MTICVSHKEDVDGIASAVLIQQAFGPQSIFLVDYGNMIDALENILQTLDPQEGKLQNIFICDLALSKKNENEFLKITHAFIRAGVKVTYIDHHDLNEDVEQELRKMGIMLIHNIEECTSIQIYEQYHSQLEQQNTHSTFYAAAAALTDYMDQKPVASKVVERFDKQFLMLEAVALSYIISANQHDNEFLVSLVKTISNGRYPHDIEDGFSVARNYSKMIGDAAKDIEASMKKLSNLAYASSSSSLSTSMIVNFILGTSGKPIAVIYKLREDLPGSCQISVRGTTECRVHLGRTVNKIATELGGNGGGHEKACGAIIPEDKVNEFLMMLDKDAKLQA